MDHRDIALVTGANQGIGYEIARGLIEGGMRVIIGARSAERGREAAEQLGPSALAMQLDVTEPASIAAAANNIREDHGRLDVLVQNAAIATAPGRVFASGEEIAAAHRPSVVPLDEMRTVWETNVFGVLAVYQAMLPLLRQSRAARIVNISSAMGSLTLASDPAMPIRSIFDASYSVSKTALNGLTLAMAIELEAEGIKVNAVSPGHTATRMTGYAGGETPAEGAAEAIRLALHGNDMPSGTLTHAKFGVLPW